MDPARLGATILIVEDDPLVSSAIADVLGAEGYRTHALTSGRDALRVAGDIAADIVLLDLGLPDVGGLDVLMEITSRSTIPVLVITGRAGETDRVIGLNLGADDYIVKPYSARELVARVNAAIRRSRRGRPQLRRDFGFLSIDESTHEVLVDDQPVDLTPREFDLLAFLSRAPRQVFSRGEILRKVWRSSPEWQDDSTVAEHVYRLRKKLDAHGAGDWLETVRGAGYRFTPPPDGPSA